MKRFVHARLDAADGALLRALRETTGQSDSELVRRGLRLVAREANPQSALDLAGPAAGRFPGGPADLSTNPGRLDEFGR